MRNRATAPSTRSPWYRLRAHPGRPENRRSHLRVVPDPAPAPARQDGEVTVLDVLVSLIAGAAASVLTTGVAAGVAGFEANGELRSVEFAIRVFLLLAAPGVGALLAVPVLSRRPVRPPAWSVGLGVLFGPILVLRLDSLLALGGSSVVAVLAALLLWFVLGTLLAGSVRRPVQSPPRPKMIASPAPSRVGYLRVDRPDNIG